MDDFKITIAAARVNAGKSQREMAESLGVSRFTLMKWEQGKTCPTVEKAEEFCKLCNIPYDRVTFSRERNAIK